MKVYFDTASLDSYRTFLAVRRCPIYSISGRSAVIPDEYADRVSGRTILRRRKRAFDPHPAAFDYQADIAELAIRKQKFAAFVECGLGKTLIMLMFARHAQQQLGSRRCVLIVSPLMVVSQTIAEAKRFFPGENIEAVRSAHLQEFLDSGSGIAITNFEAFTDSRHRGRLGALIIDESSMLKSHYGKWGTNIIALGRGLDWKLALTGTPAPNDRIEYANHAVFLDACKTVNEFLARYFVNRGETHNRWEMKPHALAAFYREISHWCMFLTNPATYGWKDNSASVPPINVNIHRVDLTNSQRRLVQKETGALFCGDIGGIGQRSRLAQIAKGQYKGERIESRKPEFIRELVDGFDCESTIIWCRYNEEQDRIAEVFPGAANIDGRTPLARRSELIDSFKSGGHRVLISKPEILGFGLNLQRATRQVFSTLQDSYEEYWQCVKRSNRIGSTVPLNVHIPITEIEEPMVQNVLRKAERVQLDTEEQERQFKERSWLTF